MTRTSADVEADVEASRNALDRDVEALKQKMTPGQLFDEATRMMGAGGQEIGLKFLEQAKANPMPLAVMGLGLAWLMSSNGSSASDRGASSEPRSFSGPSAGGLPAAAHQLGDKAGDLIADTKEKLGEAGHSAIDRTRSAADSLASAASTTRDTAGQAAQQVQRTVANALSAEPLLLAGLGLVVGAAIGAALPTTEAESHLLGESRDKVLAKGKDLAQTGLEKASEAAKATYQAVKSELETGDGDGDVAETFADAARAGARAAKDELGAPGAAD
jgi:hypothetical protein